MIVSSKEGFKIALWRFAGRLGRSSSVESVNSMAPKWTTKKTIVNDCVLTI
jgi:hypothetical protein